MSRERMFALADRIVADLTATESMMVKDVPSIPMFVRPVFTMPATLLAFLSIVF
jgi:hypothetical protein